MFFDNKHLWPNVSRSSGTRHAGSTLVVLGQGMDNAVEDMGAKVGTISERDSGGSYLK